MIDITFYLFFVALLVSFAAWCIFLWAIRTGQFRDVEDIKYQIWPAEDPPSSLETSLPVPDAEPPERA